jgi:hypothetical protein
VTLYSWSFSAKNQRKVLSKLSLSHSVGTREIENKTRKFSYVLLLALWRRNTLFPSISPKLETKNRKRTILPFSLYLSVRNSKKRKKINSLFLSRVASFLKGKHKISFSLSVSTVSLLFSLCSFKKKVKSHSVSLSHSASSLFLKKNTKAFNSHSPFRPVGVLCVGCIKPVHFLEALGKASTTLFIVFTI